MVGTVSEPGHLGHTQKEQGNPKVYTVVQQNTVTYKLTESPVHEYVDQFWFGQKV
jgi:hypothetical protein